MDPELSFALDPRLAADTRPVLDLPLSAVRLMDDARYPWLVLVPRRPGVVEILDLDPGDRLALWEEVQLCAAVLRELESPDKLNIGALGNVVPQLHLHVVARRRDDDAWPGPVWGAHPRIPRTPGASETLERRIREALEARMG